MAELFEAPIHRRSFRDHRHPLPGRPRLTVNNQSLPLPPPTPQIDYFSSESLRQGLKEKTVRGGKVTAGGQVATLLISLAAVPALARLLEPEDFGLLAMVAVLTNFARMFVDAGLSMATVQQEKITPQQVTNLFWIATALGALISVVVACLAPAVAWFYGEPRLTAITLALSVSFFMSGLAVQHRALLRRGMQFMAITSVGVLAAIAGQVVAIAWAWRHYGQDNDYWALVLIPIVTAGVGLIGTWLTCRWRPGWPRAKAGTRNLVVFGANMTAFSFVNYFARNLDNLLIGWWWGATPLGYYRARVSAAAVADATNIPHVWRGGCAGA